jgi:drug/metabolite transporter (DMT)-like permease
MANPIDPVSPKTHILALSAALLGVFFAASAYTTIRLIGSQAHALISVSYFSSLATIFTFIVMVFHPTPDTTFVLPNNVGDWTLLIGLGFAGFILQFLLTKGLQMDKSSRATSMLYLQVVFAAILDWGIWGVLPKGWSWVGGGVVVASTLWLALGKVSPPKVVASHSDEEAGLLRGEEGGEEGESDDENSITEDILVRRSSITA